MDCPECEKDMEDGFVLVDSFRAGVCWQGLEGGDLVEPLVALWSRPQSAVAFRCGVCRVLVFSPKWDPREKERLPPLTCPECGVQMEKGAVYPFIEGRHSPITVWWRGSESKKEENIKFAESRQTKYKDVSGRIGEFLGLNIAPANKGSRCKSCKLVAFKYP